MSRSNPRPHGTAAAARQHWRQGEKPCEPCRVAANLDHAQRRGGGDPYATAQPETRAAVRNGVPVVPYVYGRSSYSWAVEAIRRAEAVHGAPEKDDGADWDREAC